MRTTLLALALLTFSVGASAQAPQAPQAPAGGRGAQPGLEHVAKLVDQAREAGLPTELRIEGEAVELAPSSDLTAYRVVQEGLTNALKHAKANHAEVLVRYDGAEVEVVVRDNGRGGGSGDGGGHGLVGMRERVAVSGGELHAGRLAEGGFELRARIPVSAA